ncbi:MAG: hypothetical protein Q9217_004775 [Psora testacea]
MPQKVVSSEDQFKFLISCIRHSDNGKVDFQKVAHECTIVTKAAAAKRYERMMKAHGIHPSQHTSPSFGGNSLAPTARGKATTSAKSPKSKKRKREKVEETDSERAIEDDKTFPTAADLKIEKKIKSESACANILIIPTPTTVMAPPKEAMTEDGKKIMRWDDSTDRQLFLVCLASHDLKLDAEKLAGSLGCTTRAVQERLKFLRKIAMKEADVGSRPAAVRAAAKKPAPTVPDPAIALQKKRGPKPKPKPKMQDEGADGDAMEGLEEGEGEEAPSPMKKRKKAGTAGEGGETYVA